jgi:hypothetical protein
MGGDALAYLSEKYMGRARLLDSVKCEVEYLVEQNNPPIISPSTYNGVQEETIKRSNVIKNEGQTLRKQKKYSSKREITLYEDY